MKKISRILTAITLLLISVQSIAQDKDEVPKELLLSTLNSVAQLKIDNDQITKIIDYNKGFVDEVYKILDRFSIVKKKTSTRKNHWKHSVIQEKLTCVNS